jgi:ABC-type dipeptide/oligopeptide/nickel transport system ATPase component
MTDTEKKDKKKYKTSKSIWNTQKIDFDDAPERKFPVNWLSGHICINIFGESGCGKSTLLGGIIPLLKENLDYVYIFSLVYNPKIYNALQSWCEDNDIKFKHFSEPDYDAVEEMIKEKKPNNYALCVFDDFSQYTKSKGDDITKLQTMVCSQLRNYGVMSIFITQDSNNLTPLIQCNASTKIYFKMNDPYSVQRSSMSYKTITGRDDLRTLMKLINNNKHSYIIVTSKAVYLYMHNGGVNSVFKEIPYLKKQTK